LWQTIFRIPHEVNGVPTFGIGWALLFWLIFAVGLLVWLTRQQGWNADTRSHVPLLLIVGLVIVFVLPNIEEVGRDGPMGLAIRGYGTMMLLGVVCAVGLGVQESRRMGVDPELIFSLAFWMFVAGIIGARLTFVALEWDRVQDPKSILQTIINIVNVPDGGLVVYGALVAVSVVAITFLRRHSLPLLAFGDLIVAPLLLGLVFGRIGCLATGCCYGGVCDVDAISIAFPMNSPPYVRQLQRGQLHGFELVEDSVDGQVRVVVRSVTSGSEAETAGLLAGDRIAKINNKVIANLEDLESDGVNPSIMRSPLLKILTDRGGLIIAVEKLPSQSEPVHPTQIYSAINAACLCLLMWAYYPFRRRDGEMIALLLTVYPVTRFLLEWIRTDESGRLGTPFTISQLVSILLFLSAVGLWGFLATRPTGSDLPLIAAKEG
jgi:phosphatidylglycerol:prolipoprotein diacylglycerol transferase